MAAEKLATSVRREQIVNAALSVIAAQGLTSLSIASVAQRIGVVPSALYRHFQGKDAILDAVLANLQERLMANVSAAEDSRGGTMDQLRFLLDRHLALVTDQPGLPRLFFSEEVYGGNPARKRQMLATINRYLKAVATLVRTGQRRGDIRKGLDADAVALLFLGLVQPVAVLSQLSAGKFDVTGHAAGTWKLFRAAASTG